MAEHVVTAACVVAKVASETGEGYFYKGARLPAGVPDEEKARLVEAGLVAVVEDGDPDPSQPKPDTGRAAKARG